MAVLRLTPANTQFVKRQLRLVHPDIKSSHLTEALAAALGKRTHAALKFTLDHMAVGMEPVARLHLDHWEMRRRDLGYETPSVDQLTAIFRSTDLPDPCWREVRKQNRWAVDEWYFYCSKNNLPDIHLKLARKYVLLDWDCISIEKRCDVGVRGKPSGPIVDTLFATFQRLAKRDPTKATFQGTSFVGTIERLLPETAREIADEFFVLLYEATRIPKAEAA